MNSISERASPPPLPLEELEQIAEEYSRHPTVHSLLCEISRLQALACVAKEAQEGICRSLGNGIDVILGMIRDSLAVEPAVRKPAPNEPQKSFPCPLSLEELRQTRDTWRGDGLVRKLLWEIWRLQRFACRCDQLLRSMCSVQLDEAGPAVRRLSDMLDREPAVIWQRRWHSELLLGASLQTMDPQEGTARKPSGQDKMEKEFLEARCSARRPLSPR
ncbi:Uncharacterised protein [Achromobacter xylosoxidans]|nr:Uncharacterised protein [Achromobacter xylosoxidans]